MSYNDISESVQKKEATVRRRVKKLDNEGIIKKFTISYDIDSK